MVTKNATPPRDVDYPFPYFGQGSTRPIRAKDGLVSLIVFQQPVASPVLASLAASAPGSLGAHATPGAQWMLLTSGTDAKLDRLAGALEAWIREVHARHPVALFVVGSDGRRGPWHAWSVQQFGERVRPVVERLRAGGAGDHADWVALSFLRDGATTSFDDVRALADEDSPDAPGYANKRCLLLMPLVDALGTASLAQAGPYAELGFWACASTHEYVPDPMAHARHVLAVAAACPAHRANAVRMLAIAAAASLVADTMPLLVRMARPPREAVLRPETIPAALLIAHGVAGTEGLPLGLLETLVDAGRTHGVAQAVALAKPLLAAALERTKRVPDPQEQARAAAFVAVLAKDVAQAPDADLEAALRAVEPPKPKEVARNGSTHPHLERLNAQRLHVAYRGAREPQRVRIGIHGVPHLRRREDYGRRVRDVLAMIAMGVAGASEFAPEQGFGALLEAPPEDPNATSFAWTLELAGVGPAFWAVALHRLANPWNAGETLFDPSECPARVTIEGALAPDGGTASATTDDVLGFLADPTRAFAAWPELPFAVAEKPAKKTPIVQVRPAGDGAALAAWLRANVYALRNVLDAHPRGGRANSFGDVATAKTGIKLDWRSMSCPGTVARGPVLNVLRRAHVEGGAIERVELALPAS